jgi:hypothetical protein
MEGAGLGVINVITKNYIPLMSNNLPIGYNNPTWGNSGHTLIKPSSGVYDGKGLYFTSEDFTNIDNLSKKFNKEKSFFLKANLSYDNKQAVFTYKENYEDEILKIGIVNTNGRNFNYINEGDIQAPIFCDNKINCIMFIKEINNKYYLIEYNTITKDKNIIAKMPEQLKYWEKPVWTDNGFFAITVMSSKSTSVDKKNTRLLILDLNNKEIIYASALYNRFVNFAGFR